MINTSTVTTSFNGSLKIEDLEKALARIRGIPPTEWMLVSPDGMIWKGEEPLKLAALAALAVQAERNRVILNDI